MAATNYVQIVKSFLWTSTDTAAALLAFVQANVADPSNYSVTVAGSGAANVTYQPPTGQISGWSVPVGAAWTPSGVISAATLAASYAVHP